MKSCERFSALLSDYAENAMAPVEKSDIAAHLNECVECRSAVEGVVNLRRSLRRLPAVQASPDFETILRTRIKLDRRASAPIWGLRYASPRRLATYSAAFALAVLCVFYLWRRLPADSLPGSPSSLNVSQMQVAPNQPCHPSRPRKSFSPWTKSPRSYGPILAWHARIPGGPRCKRQRILYGPARQLEPRLHRFHIGRSSSNGYDGGTSTISFRMRRRFFAAQALTKILDEVRRFGRNLSEPFAQQRCGANLAGGARARYASARTSRQAFGSDHSGGDRQDQKRRRRAVGLVSRP